MLAEKLPLYSSFESYLSESVAGVSSHNNNNLAVDTASELASVTDRLLYKSFKQKALSGKVCAVDLFCGAGGLTYGLLQAGINVIAGYDLDLSCQYAYEHNNRVEFIHQDIKAVSLLRHKQFMQADIKIVVGCCPCQPFSKLTSRQYAKEKHKNWGLIDEYLRIVKESSPDILSMENVPLLVNHPCYKAFKQALISLGYHVSERIVFCPDYGIPQRRRRLVLLASMHGQIDLLPVTHTPSEYKTVKDALFNVPKLAAGETDSCDLLHRSQNLTLLNQQRIRASVPGGTWRDWDDSLKLACHKKPTGQTYSSIYGRMEWDKPSPTITTQSYSYGTGRHGHPEQDRAISLREAATLQTFPETYQFCKRADQLSLRTIGKMIGNAVPVRLGEVIGQSMLNHFRC